MKNYFFKLAAFSMLVSSQVLAVEFGHVDLDKAWAITCNMVDKNGHATTDYQITTFVMNKTPNLKVKFIDSVLGDNNADVEIKSILTEEGGGSDTTIYRGVIKSSTGKMFKRQTQFSVSIDFRDEVSPNIYRSKILLDNSKEPVYPRWAQERELQCELVLQ